MNLLVTGGCGFIGSNFIDMILKDEKQTVSKVVNVDSLTYAGNVENTRTFNLDQRYFFENIDLRSFSCVFDVFKKHNITHVVHLAAESHVDNSISSPDIFIETNIVGTFNLLKASKYFNVERFHHVSTDEVYGELGESGKFKETTPYNPNNPYSASKASSDLLVKSYYHTYGFPATISNCSNNYGPRQHIEKFIPTIISSINNNIKIPVYGEGLNIRDWIYVDDHCSGILEVFCRGELGQTYCIGASAEKRNIDIVHAVCSALNADPRHYIEYVADRPGHDYRYAIDHTKIYRDLGWAPKCSFEEGIQKTVEWYCGKS
tara:strand:- start:7099 stop:8052 length:954 start_codon:yes stop_codon:yes gene_type:complete